MWAKLVHRMNPYFVVSVVVTLGFVCVMVPSHSIKAELIYELGSDFLPVAFHEPLGKGIMTPSGGYLAFIARGIAAFTIKGLGCIRYYPVVAQLLGLTLAAVLTGILNLHAFRTLIENDALRCAVAIACGCGVGSDVGLTVLYNIAYFGVPMLAATIVADFRSAKRSTLLALGLLCPLVILSKGTMVLFGPFFGLRFLHALWRREWGVAGVCLAALLATGLQAYTLKTERSKEPDTQRLGAKFLLEQPAEFSIHAQKLAGRALPLVVLPPEDQSAGRIMLAVSLVAAIALIVRFRAWSVLALILLTVSVAAGIGLLTIIGNPGWYVDSLQPYNHPVASANQLLLLTTAVFLARFVPQQALLVFLGGVMLLCLVRPMPLRDHFRNRDESPSQWKLYHPLLQRERYVIPCNTGGWTLRRGIEHVGWNTPMNWPGVLEYDLAKWNHWSREWALVAVVAELEPYQRQKPIPAVILGLDETGKEVCRGVRITPDRQRFQYYIFDNPAKAVRWQFRLADGVTGCAAHASKVNMYAVGNLPAK
ncbi:MAG: hypothetical protein ACRCZF_13480 [Gemmataceae bacterium]